MPCGVAWGPGDLGPPAALDVSSKFFLNQSNLFRLLLSQQVLFSFLSFRASPLFLYHQTSWKHVLHLTSMFTCPSCWLLTPYSLVCAPPSLCMNSHEVLERSLNYQSSWLLSLPSLSNFQHLLLFFIFASSLEMSPLSGRVETRMKGPLYTSLFKAPTWLSREEAEMFFHDP